MRQSNFVTKKELLQLINVFLFSLFIVMGSIIRSNFLKGEDYTKTDLAVAFILALLMTAIYTIMMRYYKKEMGKAKQF